MYKIARRVNIECENCGYTEHIYSDSPHNLPILHFCKICEKYVFFTVKAIPLTIAIGFDGTCVKDAFPDIGEQIVKTEILQKLSHSNYLILYTMRSNINEPISMDAQHMYLTQAVKWFEERNIRLYGINENPDQNKKTHSSKISADLYIDNVYCGVPLVIEENEEPYVDWEKLSYMLEIAGIIQGGI